MRKWQKKTSFGTDFGPFGQNLVPKNFFRGFYLYQMLDIVISYRCMQFQEKLINQTWKNGKKNFFWAQFWPIWHKFGPPMFFSSRIWLRQSLEIVVSFHHVQFQKKLMIQSRENLVTDGRTDGQTDESDFIRRCPTNVEHPTLTIKTDNQLLQSHSMLIILSKSS